MSGGWLEDFVKSLGHRIMYSHGRGIQEVHSVTPRRGKRKQSRNHAWWALDRDHLDQMSKEEFYDLQMAVFVSKASRKVVFLTNSPIGGPSDRRNLLSHTLDRSRTGSGLTDLHRVVDHPGPGIVIPRTTPLPPQVSFLSALTPPQIEPWNEIEDTIISHIPWAGRGPRGCPWVILVEPEVDCAEAARRGFKFNLPEEMAPEEYPQGSGKRGGYMGPTTTEEELAWREGVPDFFHVLVGSERYPTDLEVKQEVKHRIDLAKSKLRVSSKGVLERMDECYCRILKEAVNWADHCLRDSEGRKGGVIVVRISPHGLRLGLLDRPCYKKFEEAFRKMNDVWKKEGYGVALIEDYWGVSWGVSSQFS